MTEEGTAHSEEATSSRAERLKRAKARRESDLDALELAHSDAQFTMEQTLRSFANLSGKAFRLIRLNAVVITILVAIASQVRIERYVSVLSVASLLLFISSALCALVAYLTTTFNRGFDGETFEKLVTYKVRETEYLNWVLTSGYGEWIGDSAEKVHRKERWVRLSLVAFIAGITTLLGGILLTLY